MREGLGRVRVGTTQDPKNTHHGTGKVPDVNCLRFASPAEATGGLELGDLELGGLEEACKRLGRGLEYLMGVVSGAQIS